MISIVIGEPGFAADAQKRKVSMVPGMVPMPVMPNMVPVPVPGLSTAVNAALKNTYPANHFQRGMYLKQKGDIDGALIEFLKAAQENPQNMRAFYEQAVIFRAKGSRKLAKSALQQALAIKPDYREARMLMASVHLDDGQLSQAAQELLNTLGIGPPAARESSIQTPHGRLKLPVVAPRKVAPIAQGKPQIQQPQPASPGHDAFAEATAGLNNLLKSLPAFGGAAPEQAKKPAPDTGFDAPRADGEDSAKTDNIAKQIEQIKKQTGTSRRRKRRVAAWLDKYLDRSSNVVVEEKKEETPAVAVVPPKPVTPEEPAPVADTTHGADAPKPEANPLKIVAEVLKREPEPKKVEEPVAAPTPQPPPMPQPVARTQPANTAPAPSPLDISHIWRKAMSWFRFPSFKQLAMPAPAPGAVAVALPAVSPLPSAPAPVPAAAGMPSLAPQSTRPQNQQLPVPAPTVPAVPGVPNAMPVVPSAQPVASDQNALDGVLSMLPKELAESVEHVLHPKPVDIPAATQASGAPHLQAVGVPPRNSGPGAAPAPATAATERPVYETLVEAQVPVPPQAVSQPEVAWETPAASNGIQTPRMAPVVQDAIVQAPPAPVAVANLPVAKKLATQGFKFVAPTLISTKQQYVYTAINTKPKLAPMTPPPPVVKKAPEPPEDSYAKRMKYLLANGTGTLGPGEAFMYSEETGEGVLFLPGGNSIRRKIAQPQDHEKVAQLRRPDILTPKGEMQYNLSLLGKIIKPTSETVAQPPIGLPTQPITTKEMLGKPDGIFGWIRNVFKF